MISAVDTNILLDVFLPDEKFALSSANLLKFYTSYFPDLNIISSA